MVMQTSLRDVVELWPSYESFGIRFEFFGDEIEYISYIHPVSAEILATESQVFIYPAKHYILPAERIESACASIKTELDERLIQLRHDGKLLEAQRLEIQPVGEVVVGAHRLGVAVDQAGLDPLDGAVAGAASVDPIG